MLAGSLSLSISAGDIILILVFGVIPVGLGLLELWNYCEEKRNKRMIRAAQEMEIAPGVTLLEGIRAYFGEDGFWSTSEDCVCAWAGYFDQFNATLCVNPKAEEITVYRFTRGGRDDAPLLIGALVQAAGGKTTFFRT